MTIFVIETLPRGRSQVTGAEKIRQQRLHAYGSARNSFVPPDAATPSLVLFDPVAELRWNVPLLELAPAPYLKAILEEATIRGWTIEESRLVSAGKFCEGSNQCACDGEFANRPCIPQSGEWSKSGDGILIVARSAPR